MSNAAIECTAARAMSQPCHYQVEMPRPNVDVDATAVHFG